MDPAHTQIALHFQVVGRHLALALQHAKPDGTDPQWLENNDWNGNYIGSLNQYAVDTNSFSCTGGAQIRGVGFGKKGGAKPAERWSVGHRIRDVAEAPDGALWMVEDANPGGLFRVAPK